MKKHIFIASFVALAFTSNAQIKSSKGENYLPEAGEYSFGIDATPFLNYVGNMLSSAGNNAPTQNFLNAQQTIIGKRFMTDKMAYRGILRIGISSQNSTNTLNKYGATAPTYPALPELVEDKYTEKSSFIGLGGGLEWRRGSTRLQGYYGGDLMLSFSNSSRSFEYGNALNDSTGVTALTSNFGNTYPINITNDTYGNTARITNQKDGSMLALTLRGFVGVEYFIFPKISLAGEFGWGLSFASMGGSSTELESVGNNGTDNVVGTQTIETAKGGRFAVDTDRNLTGTATGTLRLNFHF